MGLYPQSFGTSRQAGSYAARHLYVCDRAGYLTGSPSFFIQREYLDNYLLVYVLSGGFYLEAEDKRLTVEPGQTVVACLKGPHKYYSDEQNPCEILWMDFNCTADKMEPVTSLTSLPYAYSCPENFQRMKEFVDQYVNNAFFTEVQQSAALYQLLLSGVDRLQREDAGVQSTLPEIENHIIHHIGEKITVEDLARVMHLSATRFLHLFKERYGVSPIQYVIRRKLDRAAYLLLYSDLTVTQIGEQLGFSSQSHFSALFAKKWGCYPSQYRRKQRKG